METQENVQIAREAYRLFSIGDIEGILNLHADDVEFVYPGLSEVVPLAGTFRGKDQVRKFFGLVMENLEFDVFEPRDFIPYQDKVIILGYDKERVRKTGKAMEVEWVHITSFRDGKVVRWQAFFDTAREVEAFTPEREVVAG